MRAHVIENGVVADTIRVAALDQFPGKTLIDADVHGGSKGWLWNGSVLSAPEPPALPLAEQKSAKKATVTALREQKEKVPINVGGVLIAAHNGPLQRLIGAKMGGKPSRKFVTDSGQAVTMSNVQIDGAFSAADNYLQSLSDREYDLYIAIDAAADQAALDAIDINAGWPA